MSKLPLRRSYQVTMAPPAPSETIVGLRCSPVAVQSGTFTPGLDGHAASVSRTSATSAANATNATRACDRHGARETPRPRANPGGRSSIMRPRSSGTTMRPPISVHHREAARDPAPFHLQLDEIDPVGDPRPRGVAQVPGDGAL